MSEFLTILGCILSGPACVSDYQLTQANAAQLHERYIPNQFGAAVCAISDVTGDGVPEVTASTPFGHHWRAGATAFPDDNRGSVHLMDGATGEELRRLLGETPGSRFGFAICSIASETGGKDAQLAITDLGSDGMPGGVSLLSLASLNCGRRFQTQHGGDLFGFSVAAVDGPLITNGQAVAVGAPLRFSRGAVDIIEPGRMLLSLSISGTSANELFGFSIAKCNDLDSDGGSELLISAPHREATEIRHPIGAVDIRSSSSGRRILEFRGEGPDLRLFGLRSVQCIASDKVTVIVASLTKTDGGTHVQLDQFIIEGGCRIASYVWPMPLLVSAIPGDVRELGCLVQLTTVAGHGEKHAEVLVGLPVGLPDGGGVVLRIDPVRFTLTETIEWSGGEGFVRGRFGAALDAARDFNGDGTADILIGAPDVGLLEGQVLLYETPSLERSRVFQLP